ncbi:acyl-coenzyme A diphosphatase NUDT19 [Plutella xylostella]|uniref:acyl-coenzyme A diphosphatase NUDT19 n=1 Tax=Plutella xylostella TaxID=51655 RepID=UPI002032CC12|nr:acyl-coenzyme A diphosphatase NUDT19 [Plutella xylostella]
MLRKTWRDSSSLIVVAKQQLSRCEERGGVNYDMLLQTRSQGASSFASSVVFPGGVAEAADARPEWVTLIKSFGYSQTHFDALHCSQSIVTPIFQHDPLQKHVSLRITAIRETFEEVGVLICSKKKQAARTGPWAEYVTNFDVKYWQNKVSKNPEELFNLCQELNCYPDIWSLHYWSNWLTPSTLKKRFDTAFFICALKDQVVDVTGSNEVSSIEWGNPTKILEKEKKGEVILFPPQIYEFNRITHVKDVEELVKFAQEISCHGNELFYPVHLRAKDGWVHLLPGDDLYPTKLDYNNDKILKEDQTVEQLRENCSVLHRFEHSEEGSGFVIRNLSPPHHISMDDRVISLRNYL